MTRGLVGDMVARLRLWRAIRRADEVGLARCVESLAADGRHGVLFARALRLVTERWPAVTVDEWESRGRAARRLLDAGADVRGHEGTRLLQRALTTEFLVNASYGCGGPMVSAGLTAAVLIEAGASGPGGGPDRFAYGAGLMQLAAVAVDDGVSARLHQAANAWLSTLTDDELNSARHEGRSVLHAAAQCGYGFIGEIIARQSSLDEPDKSGWRATHLAARHGHTDALRSLLEAGASERPLVLCDGGDGKVRIVTLEQLALKSGQIDTVLYLQTVGARKAVEFVRELSRPRLRLVVSNPEPRPA